MIFLNEVFIRISYDPSLATQVFSRYINKSVPVNILYQGLLTNLKEIWFSYSMLLVQRTKIDLLKVILTTVLHKHKTTYIMTNETAISNDSDP